MLDAGVQVDLEGQLGLHENLLGLGALLRGEDAVGLGGGDGYGAGDGGQLVGLDEAGVGDVGDVNAALEVADGVLCAEAVAEGADLCRAVLLLESLDAGDDDGVDLGGCVRLLVVGAIEDPVDDILSRCELVAVEDVGDDGGVAVGGELVGDQLRVRVDAPDVRDEDQAGAGVGLVGGRLGDVGLDGAVGDLDELSGGSAPRRSE